MKFHNQWTSRPVYEGQIMNNKSMTIPDQSLTISEVIKRFQRGIPFSVGLDPIYYEDPEISEMFANYHKLDIEERHQLIIKNAAKIKDKRREIAIQQEEAKILAAEQKLMAKIEQSEKSTNVT